MNKKGQFSGFVFGMGGIFVLILVLVSLSSIDSSNGELTKEEVYSKLDNTSKHVIDDLRIEEGNSVVINVVYSFVHFIIYSSFEVTKAAVGYGVDNPDVVNPNTLLTIILISLLIPIIWYGFLMIVSIILITREWYLNKKEKKR